ncbi:MAG: MBL fold metallo-hydrolase [Candidatus Pacebacteria bacterium]|nr:MBL fold metallo-hydrolase [Candidatus Paceibacterota bacterium]
MQIIWKGQSCFQISLQPEKNSQVRIVIDPFDETLGLKLPSMEADILLITHHHRDHDNSKAIKGNPFLVDGPGEYEIKKIYIQGIFSFHDDSQGKQRGENTIYTIEAEDFKLCHLGDLGQKELSASQIEKIGNVDILMIPIGGVYTIDSKGAQKIISQIEPKIIIPMHYQIPSFRRAKAKVEKKETSSTPKLDSLDKFLKVMGIKTAETLNKLLIKKKDLSEEGLKVVVLGP